MRTLRRNSRNPPDGERARADIPVMTFRIHPLTLTSFTPLFALDDAALQALGARRMFADTPHSAPCRVSLTDAVQGEALLLVSHRHLDTPGSPYRSEGPVFVREAATQAVIATGEVPDMLARRLLSARAYDADDMMADADVVEGVDLAERLADWFTNPMVTRVQIHTARRGCFMAEARRA
ncbi:MAG: DUF1203 domain-containing protein [Brevundimonas sp.]|nr:MAG: DUF1203 domain-containing protein [Brevundimonas sp.]